MASISGNGAPNKYTPGELGDIYTNSTTGERYKLVSINITQAYDTKRKEYNWEEIYVSSSGDGGSAVSPTVSVVEITGGHKVNITDVNGINSFNVMDGEQGEDGAPGPQGEPGPQGPQGIDGKSILSITKDDNNNIITTFTDGTTQNIGQLNIDVAADFLTEVGFGNLRYINGTFQYYEESTSSWVDTTVGPENIYIMNMIPKEMKSFSGYYDVNSGYNKLKWEEPDDTVYDGQVFCLVDRVVIRRKLGSIPTNETDGDLVIEIPRNLFGMYKNIFYIDRDVTPVTGEMYYYKAFPQSTMGYYNTATVNEAIIECRDYHLFGFKIDQNESDPTSMITYIADNAGFASAYMDYTADVFNYGDWSAGNGAWFMDVKPCMLNYDGTVAYYLNPDDYSLKEDGTASDVADDTFAGNVMIEVPKTYWKIVDNGDDTANIYISNKKVDEDFVCWSHIDNNGNEIDYCYMPAYNGSIVDSRLRSISGKTPIYDQTGAAEINYAKANNLTDDVIWYTELFSDRQLINLLLLLISKSTDTQTTFGNGYSTGGSSNSNPRIATGTMNTKGLFWGSNGSSMVGVKVFGIEHWWGNQTRRIGGWIVNRGIQQIKLTYGQTDGSTVDGYNTDGSGYISIGCTPNGTSGGYISKMTVTKYGLIPTSTNGSATTYYTDTMLFNNSIIGYAHVGGASSYSYAGGALFTYLSDPVTEDYWTIGAALSCKPLDSTI